MKVADTSPSDRSAWAVFTAFLRLGFTAFGGPVAHLAYFRDEFVLRRRWLSERAYADLVGLCQFLPGPASSQVGMALGLSRAGLPGALAAWLGFTLPSALALIALALLLGQGAGAVPAGLLHGLKLAAVAVVAQAVWGMGRQLCTDSPRIVLMVAAAAASLLWPGVASQVLVLAGAALLGRWWLPAAAPSTPAAMQEAEALHWGISRRMAGLCLVLLVALLLGLPLLRQVWPSPALAQFDAFFRSGAAVFGGGHVVLPLLQAEVVPTGWVDADRFLAGYGATQAMPGPLFTFAAFLGASMQAGPTGVAGGLLCLVAIFVPACLLLAAALPLWERLRRHAPAQAALAGVNAAVVGLLLAAWYQPVWTGAVHAAPDFALALVALAALMAWRCPPWLVVAGCALAGWILSALG